MEVFTLNARALGQFQRSIILELSIELSLNDNQNKYRAPIRYP